MKNFGETNIEVRRYGKSEFALAVEISLTTLRRELSAIKDQLEATPRYNPLAKTLSPVQIRLYLINYAFIDPYPSQLSHQIAPNRAKSTE